MRIARRLVHALVIVLTLMVGATAAAVIVSQTAWFKNWLRGYIVRSANSYLNGTLSIERRPDGGQYGVCVFTDNYQCEEWAMFRGECPVGGLRVTGYITPAARYCAIAGGRYAVVANSGTADEQGACGLPGGKVCNADAYYAGTCSR